MSHLIKQTNTIVLVPSDSLALSDCQLILFQHARTTVPMVQNYQNTEAKDQVRIGKKVSLAR